MTSNIYTRAHRANGTRRLDRRRLRREAAQREPGQKWRVEIDAALEQCQTILVFWCEHAAQSSEVRSEYERAVSLGKRVVPVLIDDTALPPDLGQYQGVDLRTTFFFEHHRQLIGWLELLPPSLPHEQALETLERGDTGFKKIIEHVDRTIASVSQQLESSLNSIFDQ